VVPLRAVLCPPVEFPMKLGPDLAPSSRFGLGSDVPVSPVKSRVLLSAFRCLCAGQDLGFSLDLRTMLTLLGFSFALRSARCLSCRIRLPRWISPSRLDRARLIFPPRSPAAKSFSFPHELSVSIRVFGSCSCGGLSQLLSKLDFPVCATRFCSVP
jgi:hypothetical protein